MTVTDQQIFNISRVETKLFYVLHHCIHQMRKTGINQHQPLTRVNQMTGRRAVDGADKIHIIGYFTRFYPLGRMDCHIQRTFLHFHLT